MLAGHPTLKRHRGQALTEIVLVAPIFALLLLVFALWTRLALSQLALVQLTRDATLMLARNGELWEQPAPTQRCDHLNLR